MKTITIYQENADPLVMYDEDDTDKTTYAKNLSEIFSYHTITILITTHSVALIRPSAVTSITVNEEQNKNGVTDIPAKPKIKKVEETEDIITDA